MAALDLTVLENRKKLEGLFEALLSNKGSIYLTELQLGIPRNELRELAQTDKGVMEIITDCRAVLEELVWAALLEKAIDKMDFNCCKHYLTTFDPENTTAAKLDGASDSEFINQEAISRVIRAKRANEKS